MILKKIKEQDRFNIFWQLLLSLVVLACGVFFTIWLVQTSPRAKTKKKEAHAVLVEVETLRSEKTKNLLISAMGTVLPALEVELKARVSGEVVATNDNILPGGFVKKGETLFRLDPIDYQIIAKQLASEVKKAENDLEIERGNQLVAQKEFELLGERVRPEEKKLILRQPQLEILKASLESARAKYKKGKLDIERTTIKAPFNGVIQDRFVNVGSQITAATPLIRLVGTDEFWIEVVLPVSKLRWLKIPLHREERGSLVTVTSESGWGKGIERKGRVVRLAADLEEKGRMAKVLVNVLDPLLLKEESEMKPPLLMGSFVQVEIAGISLHDAVIIQRKSLRDGNYVWLMDSMNTLRIQKVDIIYKDHDRVFIKGVSGGETIIVSDLSVAVDGMPVRLGNDRNAAKHKVNPYMDGGLEPGVGK